MANAKWALAGIPGAQDGDPALPVRVAECRLGLGVFAVTPFRPGDEILAMTGPVIDIREPGGWDAVKDESDVVQVSRFEYVDPDRPGRLVNHSCQPNAGLRPDLVLIALQPVAAGEEICFDYSCTVDEDDFWTMKCDCRTPSCRGIVGDFWRLPRATRRRYLTAGVVQEFIARRYWDDP